MTPDTRLELTTKIKKTSGRNQQSPNQIAQKNARVENNLSESVAAKIFVVIPSIMQTIRHEMRTSVHGLTIPQFRILARLESGPTNHCELADWVGVSLPAISRMVNMLEERGLVTRDRQRQDRRYVHLTLTESGLSFFKKCRNNGQKSLAKKFNQLSSDSKEVLLAALNALGSALMDSGETNDKSKNSSSDSSNVRRGTLRMRSATK